MIELGIDDRKKVENLYNEIKNIIISKKNNPSFNYEKHQHHLYEEAECPGISKGYYNESGSVQFENVNEDLIIIEISRYHPHKHNGCSGLNSCPCLFVEIYTMKGDEKQILWELEGVAGTMYYKAKVTSLEIPEDILKEKSEKVEEIQKPSQEINHLEKKSILDELNKATDGYITANNEKEKILLERKARIDKATEEITQSYAERLEQCDKDIMIAKAEINSYDNLFNKYSTFEDNLVGIAIQQVINIVEGLSFQYQTALHNVMALQHGVWGGQGYETSTLRKVKLVINSHRKQNEYTTPLDGEGEITQLVNDGEAILLCELKRYMQDDHKINFYTSENGQISCNVNFGRFEYIKDFIDFTIKYRFQNNIEDFTKEDMITCIQGFVSTYNDIIIQNYTARINTRVLNLSL